LVDVGLVLIESCAMLDLDESQITVCMRVPEGEGGRRQEAQEFQTTTAGLIMLADSLQVAPRRSRVRGMAT
jgi:hypothetical protein